MRNLNRLLLVAAVLTAALFSSCKITEKQRQEICNTCPVKTERRDSIVYKRDTVRVEVPGKPGPTVYLDNPCKLLCDSLGHLRNVDIKTTKNGQTLHINTMGNGINVATETRDTALAVPVTTKETFHDEKEADVKYVPCANERTAFDGFTRYWFYITALFLLIAVGWRAGKAYLKRLGK
jgi:hypothetical protein